MKGQTKKWIIGLAILLLFGLMYFFIKMKLNAFDRYPTGGKLNEDSLKFNASDWKNQSGYGGEIRPYMLTDLRKNVLVAGMDSSAVKDLLGETWGPHDRYLWTYRLGVYREIEASYFEIVFDDKGKLKKTEIIDR
jgi:hypothetical protein